MSDIVINNRAKAYTEILEILKCMDNKYIECIPSGLKDFFMCNCDKNYLFKIDHTKSLKEQQLSPITLNLLAMINLNYWCKDIRHKEELIKNYNENEKNYQSELSEKYNIDNLFKKKIVEESTPNEEIHALVEYKEKSFIQKVIDRIKSLFKR